MVKYPTFVGSSLHGAKIFIKKLSKPSVFGAIFLGIACGELREKSEVDPRSDPDANSGVFSPQGADGSSKGSGGFAYQGPLEGIAAIVRTEIAAYQYIGQVFETAFPPSAEGVELRGHEISPQDQSGDSLDIFEASSFSPYELIPVAQSALFSSCTTDGEPWDPATNGRMDPTKKEYAQRAFYCQLNASDSVKTIRGALEQNRRLFCDVEKTLGNLSAGLQEKTYKSITINLTPACGWTPLDLKALGRSQLTGDVTTQSFTAGEWQKKVILDFPSSLPGVKSTQLTLFVTATKTTLAFKEIQSWKMREEKEANQYVAQSASGRHGHVIVLDFAAGTLRAESVDSYWGRRVRLLAQGVLDVNTGRFKSLDSLQALYGRFNKAGDEAHTFVENAVASVKGSALGGFAYLSGTYYCPQDAACNPNNNELFSYSILNQSKMHCVPLTASCAGNQGLSWNMQKPTLDFLMVGAAWDDLGQKRMAFETWLSTTGLLKFGQVDFAPLP